VTASSLLAIGRALVVRLRRREERRAVLQNASVRPACLWLAGLVTCGGGAVTRTAIITPPAPRIEPSASTARPSAPPTPQQCLDSDPTLDMPQLRPRPIDDAAMANAVDTVATGVGAEFARARRYFEARHWVEAARAFRSIAMSHSDDDTGIFAAQMYIECVNLLGSHAQRPACFDDLAREVPQLKTLYCEGRRSTHEEQCEIFSKIAMSIAMLAAQKLIERADRHPDEPAAYREGGSKYMAVLDEYCLGKSGFEHCDEVAFNAAVAFVAAKDLTAATRLRDLMLDPKNGMSRSPLAKRLVCRLDATNPGCALP
jgi:hypothetical protein